MSRLAIAPTIADAPEASRPLLEAVRRALGSVPNVHRLFAASPAALAGYVGLGQSLARGRIEAATGERIALAVAEVNGCDYCLAAHAFLGARVGLDADEIEANRGGRSNDARADAAVRFAREVTERRGAIGSDALAAVRDAGYTDAEILEIVAHVAINTLTNYANQVAETEIDFPVLAPRRAA